MAEIPRSLLNEYTAQLNMLSVAGQKLVLAALENAEWSTIAELRNIMIAVMDEVCSVLAADAAVIASNMYDDVREVSIGKRFGQLAPSAFDGAATAGAVRALIQSVVESGATDVFGHELAGRVDREVKRSANLATVSLASRDPEKPRWARVPSGLETCSFCIMLASRGFDYHSEETASHAHPNCDCRVVQGYNGVSIEGYDLERYERFYSDNAVYDENNRFDEYKTLYAMEKQLKLERAIAENIDYSKVPRSFFGVQRKITDYSKDSLIKRGNEWRDLFAHDSLALDGRKVVPRIADAPKGFSNIDAFVDGALCEIKSPEAPKVPPKPGNELSFIDANLRKAAEQFRSQYDPSTGGKLVYSGENTVVLNLRYRPVPTDVAKPEIRRVMKNRGIDKVILITQKGNVIEIK